MINTQDRFEYLLGGSVLGAVEGHPAAAPSTTRQL
jgi:hypothetical protein